MHAAHVVGESIAVGASIDASSACRCKAQHFQQLLLDWFNEAHIYRIHTPFSVAADPRRRCVSVAQPAAWQCMGMGSRCIRSMQHGV